MYLVSLFRLILKHCNCGNHKSLGRAAFESAKPCIVRSTSSVLDAGQNSELPHDWVGSSSRGDDRPWYPAESDTGRLWLPVSVLASSWDDGVSRHSGCSSVQGRQHKPHTPFS